MKTAIIILAILSVVTSCISVTEKTNNVIEEVDYGRMVEDYLRLKTIEPIVVFNNNDRNEIELLGHKISWSKLDRGIRIIIDEDTITTSDKVTLNPVWGSGIDSINFANYLQQVKIYEDYSLIGFVLSSSPCNGSGCGVNYQIIYDLKTKRQSFFGRFRTGFEFELYDFNSDSKPDYLSKTFLGRHVNRLGTIEFVMYTQNANGFFEEFKTASQARFWFKHIYTEFQADLQNEGFEEEWIEKINIK